MAQARNPMSAEALGAFVREKIKTNGVPGLSVAVVKGDRVVWGAVTGMENLSKLPCLSAS